MAIKSNWMDHKPGWQERYNQLIDAINEYDNPDSIKPKLTEKELEWYNKSLERLKAENVAIANECKAYGTEPWKTYYNHV